MRTRIAPALPVIRIPPTASTHQSLCPQRPPKRLFIESPVKSIGTVCVIPIGITEISSVTINVKPGGKVEKGGELGWFSYGGSTLALVFQKGAIKKFTVSNDKKGPDNGPPIKVNQQIAEAV